MRLWEPRCALSAEKSQCGDVIASEGDGGGVVVVRIMAVAIAVNRYAKSRIGLGHGSGCVLMFGDGTTRAISDVRPTEVSAAIPTRLFTLAGEDGAICLGAEGCKHVTEGVWTRWNQRKTQRGPRPVPHACGV